MSGVAAPLIRDPLPGWLASIGPRWLVAIDLGGTASPPLPDARLPIARLARALALDPPAVALVELLVAAEQDAALAARLAHEGGVTVALARRLLPDLDPRDLALAGPLRANEVLRLGDGPRALASLRIGEAMLDRLTGGHAIDPAVGVAVRAVEVSGVAMPALRDALTAALGERDAGGLSPVVLAGDAGEERIAAALAAIGLVPWRLLPDGLPADAGERARWARLWSRDAALVDGALIVPGGVDPPGLAGLIDGLVGHVVLLDDGIPGLTRGTRRIAPGEGDPEPARWRQALGPAATARLGPALAGAARRFHVDGPALGRLAADATPAILAAPDDRGARRALWHAAARAVPPRPLAGCFRREPHGAWADLVLPPAVKQRLRDIEDHVHHAERVFHDWGFAARLGGRGTGVAALFTGASGTGKTFAAEVIAAALGLPMLVVDLAQLLSKYVGETSKNVAAAFAEARRTGAMMVWNEGDAMFGARGNVVNAADRHANAEVGDLLEKIELFEGVTIVTSNLRASIDPAFLRRFRFIVDFPMPSEVERRAIWARAFPAGAPVTLDDAALAALATVSVTGGAIRNAALAAAFAAAAGDRAIDLPLVADALARELAKTGQPMPALALGGAA